MAKTMAKIEDNTVSALLWCSDGQKETAVLKELNGVTAAAGDEWRDGRFYRGDRLLLSSEGELELLLAELVETVYEGDLEVIG